MFTFITPKQIFLAGMLALNLCYTPEVSAERLPQQDQIDSLYILIPTVEGEERLKLYRKIFSLTRATPDSVFVFTLQQEMLTEARKQKNKVWESRALYEPLRYYHNSHMHAEYDAYWPGLLAFAKEYNLWNEYFNMYGNIVSHYIGRTEHDKALQLARDMYETAKALDNKEGLGGAAYGLGRIYAIKDREAEAEAAYREAETHLLHDDVENLDCLFDLYSSLALILKSKGNEEEFFTHMQKWEKLAAKYTSDDQPHYPIWFDINHLYFGYYCDLGQMDKAEQYLMKSGEYAAYMPYFQVDYKSSVTNFYYKQKDFEKALTAVDDLLETARRENQIGAEVVIQEWKSDILENLGHYKEALELYHMVVQAKDSLDNISIAAQVDELRTQYEVDRHILEKQRNRSYFYLALVGCLLLLIALTIWILYSHRLRAKNRVLYEQIQARNQCRIINENTLIARPKEELSRELSLYRELSLVMKKEKLFTDPALDRRMLAEHLGTNEKYIADAIHAGSQETLSAYITRLRLQYATELLDTQSDLTLEAIATDAGFGSYPPFYRAFSKTYGMTPRDYRLLAQYKKK